MQGEAETSSQVDAEVSDQDVEASAPCPPDQMCTQADSDGDTSVDLYAEGTLEATVDAELDLGLEDLDDVELPEFELPEDDEEPAPSEDASDEEDAPEEAEDEQDASEQQSSGNASISSYADGSGSLDANGSAESSTTISADAEEEPAPEENASDEEDAPEETEDEQTYGEDLPVETVVQGEQEVEIRDLTAYLEVRQRDQIDIGFESQHQAQPAPELPVESQVDASENGSVRMDFRGAFEASSAPVTGAYASVAQSVTELVNKVKGAFGGSAEVSSEVTSVTEVEAAENVAGELGVDSAAEGIVDAEIGDAIEVPEPQAPKVNADSRTEAESETKISSSLTGDLGVGL